MLFFIVARRLRHILNRPLRHLRRSSFSPTQTKGGEKPTHYSNTESSHPQLLGEWARIVSATKLEYQSFPARISLFHILLSFKATAARTPPLRSRFVYWYSSTGTRVRTSTKLSLTQVTSHTLKHSEQSTILMSSADTTQPASSRVEIRSYRLW